MSEKQTFSSVLSSSLLVTGDTQTMCQDEAYICSCFRSLVKDMRPTDEGEFIRHMPQYFRECSEHAEICTEIKFCLFEKFLTTKNDVIPDSLQEFLEYCIPREHQFETSVDKLTISSHLLQYRLLRNFVDMQRILRYGMRFEVGPNAVCSTWDPLIGGFYRKYGWVPRLIINPRSSLMELVDSLYPISGNNGLLSRLYQILLAITIALDGDIYSTELEKCLKLMFEANPESLISVQEISRCLDKMLTDETEKAVIKEICDDFSKKFPESPEAPEPRSLQHLCRCSVRQSLRDARELPHGVWSLRFPKILQNYLLLQKKKNEFYPKYMSLVSAEE